MDHTQVAALIEQYATAWSEPDAAARQPLLERVWQSDGTYIDPISHASDRAGLSNVIGRFLAGNEGAKFTIEGKIDHHHQHIRFYWTLHLSNGSKIPGMDYGEINHEGKLSKIVGFF